MPNPFKFMVHRMAANANTKRRRRPAMEHRLGFEPLEVRATPAVGLLASAVAMPDLAPVALNPQPLPPDRVDIALNPQPLPPDRVDIALNPQPLPPDRVDIALNPQPLPPDRVDIALNPQPLPPGRVDIALNPQPVPPDRIGMTAPFRRSLIAGVSAPMTTPHFWPQRVDTAMLNPQLLVPSGNRFSGMYEPIPDNYLSHVATLDVATGLLSILGNDQKDIAVVREFGAEIVVTFNNQSTRYATDAVHSIEFYGYGGDDEFYNLTRLSSLAFGHEGDDILYGGLSADRLFGGDGNDLIRGGGTDNRYDWDRIEAGAGDDRIYGDAGNDEVFGEEGNDVIWGGSGDDTIRSQAGDDLVVAGNGNDYVEGGMGNDRIFGQNGDDILSGQQGDDHIDGGAGWDQIWGDDGTDVIRAGDGNDYVEGGDGNDDVEGGSGDDVLSGQAGDDIFYAGTGQDQVWGDEGADKLYGGSGGDHLDGGYDDDEIFGDAGDDYVDGGVGFDITVSIDPDRMANMERIRMAVDTLQPQTDGVSCGPNSASRLLRFYGYNASYNDARALMSATGNVVSYFQLGTPPTALLHIMRNWRGDSQLEMRTSFSRVLQLLGSGKPVVALVGLGITEIFAVGTVPETLHYVTLTGFDQATQQIFYTDTNGQQKTWTYSEFQAVWNFPATGLAGDALTGTLNVKERTILY